VFDYEAQWVFEIQPQGKDFRYVELCFRWYEAARRLGLDIDILRPGESIKGYALVLVPSLPIISDAAERAFKAAEGVVLYGPRTGSKTRTYAIPSNLPPGPLQALLGLRVLQVSSLRPGLVETVKGSISGTASRWVEHIETTSKVLARFSDKTPALASKGKHHYLACWPDAGLLERVMKQLTKAAKLKVVALPPHIRLRQRGNFMFAFNYGPKFWFLPKGTKPVLGKSPLGPQDFAVWRT